MSLTLIGILLSAASAIWAYVIHLKNEVSSHKLTIDILKSEKSGQEWANRIDRSKDNVKETERDYRDAIDLFKRNNPDSKG